jgi:hypothetical protein
MNHDIETNGYCIRVQGKAGCLFWVVARALFWRIWLCTIQNTYLSTCAWQSHLTQRSQASVKQNVSWISTGRVRCAKTEFRFRRARVCRIRHTKRKPEVSCPGLSIRSISLTPSRGPRGGFLNGPPNPKAAHGPSSCHGFCRRHRQSSSQPNVGAN